MNAALKSVVLATTFAALLGVVGPIAQAAPPQIQLRLSTGGGSPYLRPAAPQAPQLGFYGHFEWGTGMIVDSVPWGTPARQMGLEAGDTIVAIDGYWLQSQNDYYRALQYSGGMIRVTVQDIRTGR